MKTVQQLKDERLAIIAQAEAILDLSDESGKAITAEDRTKYETLLKRAEELNSDITMRMKLEAVSEPTFTREPIARAQPTNIPSNEPIESPSATIREDENGIPRVQLVRSYGKLHAFAQNQQGYNAAYRSGMWVRATIYGDESAKDWCRRNGVGPRAALSGGVPGAGGYLVPDEFERSIIDLREEYGILRQVADIVPMGSDTKNIPRRATGLTASYVSEGVAGTESDASWTNVQLTAKKLMVVNRMSSEVAEDAIIDLADKMAMEAAYALAIKEDTVGFTGTGIAGDGLINGINTVALDGAHNKAKVAGIATHNTLPEITTQDVINLMAAIPQYAKPGAAFVCSPTAYALVFEAIKAAGGGHTSATLEQATRPTFLGYPVYITPVMPDDPTAVLTNLVMIGFGNLRQAVTIGDRRGIRIALSNEKYWLEDQIGIKVTMRHDINVHDLGSNTVKSPYAVLVGTL